MIAVWTGKINQRQAAAIGLHTFMRLPVAQRSKNID